MRARRAGGTAHSCCGATLCEHAYLRSPIPCLVCAWIYWEEDRRMHTSKVGGKIPDDLVSDAIAPWRTGLGADEEWVETCHQVLSGYFTLFVTLLELSIDPYPEVASCAKTVVDYIMALLLESPFTRLPLSSLHMSSQPSIPSSHH